MSAAARATAMLRTLNCAWWHGFIVYSGQDHDRVSALAQRLTDADRAEGSEAPAYGHSAANWTAAEAALRAETAPAAPVRP